MSHLKRTDFTDGRVRRLKCPTCEKRTKFFGRFEAWYGWLITCLSCGDQWQDGEMLPRPFERGWRTKSVKRAKRALREWIAKGGEA